MAKGGAKRKFPIWLTIILVIIVILLLAAVITYRSMSKPYDFEIDRGIPAEGIDILDMPLSVEPGESFTVTWRLINAEPNVTAVHYSYDPVSDDLDYGHIAIGTEQEDGTYTATVQAPEQGAVFLKIFAANGAQEYWSDEVIVWLPEEEVAG